MLNSRESHAVSGQEITRVVSYLITNDVLLQTSVSTFRKDFGGERDILRVHVIVRRAYARDRDNAHGRTLEEAGGPFSKDILNSTPPSNNNTSSPSKSPKSSLG